MFATLFLLNVLSPRYQPREQWLRIDLFCVMWDIEPSSNQSLCMAWLSRCYMVSMATCCGISVTLVSTSSECLLLLVSQCVVACLSRSYMVLIATCCGCNVTLVSTWLEFLILIRHLVLWVFPVIVSRI